MVRRMLLLAAVVATAACGDDRPPSCDEDSAFGMHGSAEDARMLTANMSAMGFVCGFERDWWVVAASDGCVLSFDLSFQNADGDLGMAMYVVDDEPGLIDMSFGDGDNERVAVGMTEARDYYAEVRAQGGRASSARAAYDLLATLDCGDATATDTDDPTTGMTDPTMNMTEPTMGMTESSDGTTLALTDGTSTTTGSTTGPTDPTTTTDPSTSSSSSTGGALGTSTGSSSTATDDPTTTGGSSSSSSGTMGAPTTGTAT